MYEIHTLSLGELLIPLPHGGVLRDPVHAWLVTDGSRCVLVDSGMPDMGLIRQRLRVEGSGGGPDALRAALREAGVEPGDVTHIVATHLHFDHAWNLDLFPEACVVVQREEVFHAVDPSPTQRIYYLRETLLDLLSRRRPTALRLVEGDLDLLPGLRLLKTPGHTPGMQVAVVETAHGRVGLVSDLGDHYRYWYPADPRATEMPMRVLADSFVAGPIRTESERTYTDSMRRVMAAADIVVPAHDARIPRRLPRDWFDVPPG